MYIKEKTYQNRRDFKAIFKCGHCGFEQEIWGYDDTNFHLNIIPNMTCPECGEKEGDDYVQQRTKYPDGAQV